ncbi:MAG TPA: GIY-YIG nuclease family protein [Alphaproteobacteria bacterium]|nr:GIY-YIG nuclease family protein [Alphaproteobacteria bacterium]
MRYVYFLQLDNGNIYVGSTNGLRRRVGSHRRGHVRSTKACLPMALKS